MKATQDKLPFSPTDLSIHAEPCTTWARSKRHYSTNLRPFGRGRSGWALCGAAVMDQLRVHHFEIGSRRRTDISALPECKKCARRRGGG